MESGLVGGECEGCVIEKLRINVYLRSTVRSVILIVPSVIVLVYNKL